MTLSANRYKAGPDSSQYLTVDVYERKDGRYSRTVEGACFVDFLEKTLGVKVIPISRPDELNYANNYLTIGPRRIIACPTPRQCPCAPVLHGNREAGD